MRYKVTIIYLWPTFYSIVGEASTLDQAKDMAEAHRVKNNIPEHCWVDLGNGRWLACNEDDEGRYYVIKEEP